MTIMNLFETALLTLVRRREHHFYSPGASSCARTSGRDDIILVDDHPLFREALRSTIRLGLPHARIEEADSIGRRKPCWPSAPAST